MKSCLVVDDSKVVRSIAVKTLANMGFRCAEAADGRQALDAAAADTPDLVLLDWNMPVMSGIEFLRELRGTPEGATPKVVFCTTENDVERIQEALEAGADEYIMKPFDAEILHDKLSQIGMA